MLEHESDPPLLDRRERLLLVGQRDPAAVGDLQAGDHPQDGALARAARPEDRRDLPVHRLERDVLHGVERTEPLVQILDTDPVVRHVARFLSYLAFMISMPESNTIDAIASVRATM